MTDSSLFGDLNSTHLRLRIRRAIGAPWRALVEGRIRRSTTEAVVAAALLFLIWIGATQLGGNVVVIQVVSVPKALDEAGYTPVAIAQRFVNEMSRAGDLRETEESQIATGGLTRQHIVTTDRQFDIQVPGQGFSLRAVVTFVKNAIGLGDTVVFVATGANGDDVLTADIAVAGGPYDGTRRRAYGTRRDVDDFLRTASLRALEASQPLAYAGYLTDNAPANCMASADCPLREAESVLTRLLVNGYTPDDAAARLGLAAVKMRERAHADALRHCRLAQNLDRTVVWTYIYCAYALVRLDQTREALAEVETVVAMRVRDPDLHASLGDLMMSLHRPKEAAQHYQLAVALNPRQAYSLIGLGTLARNTKRWVDAEDYYRRALDLNPVEPYANGGLGLALNEQRRHAEAIPHLTRAWKFDNDYARSLEEALEHTGPTAAPR